MTQCYFIRLARDSSLIRNLFESQVILPTANWRKRGGCPVLLGSIGFTSPLPPQTPPSPRSLVLSHSEWSCSAHGKRRCPHIQTAQKSGDITASTAVDATHEEESEPASCNAANADDLSLGHASTEQGMMTFQDSPSLILPTIGIKN